MGGNSGGPPATHITITVGDETFTQQLDPARPDHPLYFSVGRPGRHSGMWRVWGQRHRSGKSDVYAAVRTIAGEQKFSIHESGDYRFQWSTTAAAKQYAGTADRRIYAWSRGPEYEGGLTKALTVFTPSGELSEIADDSPPADCVWLPEAREGWVIGVHLAIAQPDRGEFSAGGTVPVGGFLLADGSALLALAFSRAMSDAEREQIASDRALVPWDRFRELARDGAPRLSLQSVTDDGDAWILDLVARP